MFSSVPPSMSGHWLLTMSQPLCGARQEADAQAKFTEVRKAYDTLSDPAKREVYDRYGREATERMESSGGDPGVCIQTLTLCPTPEHPPSPLP